MRVVVNGARRVIGTSWEHPSRLIPLGLPCPCGRSRPHRRRPQGMSLS